MREKQPNELSEEYHVESLELLIVIHVGHLSDTFHHHRHGIAATQAERSQAAFQAAFLQGM